jgi:hypothetical protein
VEELLSQIAALKTKADAGGWVAEAELASALQNSGDLFWRLKTFAVLNAP